MGRRRIFLRGGRQQLPLAVARLEAADFEHWLAQGERRRGRRFAAFAALSIALHALLFLVPRPEQKEQPLRSAAGPLSVRILDPEPEAPAATPPPASPTPPTPAPPRPRPPVVPPPVLPPRVVAEAPKVPVPIPEPVPAPPAPPMDMMAMVEAKREQRRRAQEAAGKSPPSDRAPKDDPALASINRNLATLRDKGEGVGGVFQILRKGVRTGEFAFNGWRPDANRSWREVIEVDAGQGGDVERAMVRRMIELIRSHYQGDFQWESHRLQRVVTLSARPQDNEGLEEFLVREFFGPPAAGRSR